MIFQKLRQQMVLKKMYMKMSGLSNLPQEQIKSLIYHCPALTEKKNVLYVDKGKFLRRQTSTSKV